VDEASAMLLAIRAPATTITLEVETLTDRLEIVVRSDVEVTGWPAPGMESTVGWTVLSALVDDVRTETRGGPALRLVKRIQGPAPTG
jgi:anti-sigma regulatory factor (Ser/Thr protein kinase)